VSTWDQAKIYFWLNYATCKDLLVNVSNTAVVNYILVNQLIHFQPTDLLDRQLVCKNLEIDGECLRYVCIQLICIFWHSSQIYSIYVTTCSYTSNT
jgi:hypothetical protein